MTIWPKLSDIYSMWENVYLKTDLYTIYFCPKIFKTALIRGRITEIKKGVHFLDRSFNLKGSSNRDYEYWEFNKVPSSQGDWIN